jgi:bifunctional UDP-N-acetylglucosamine pyrophosphorylase/glucosamine-1-phosphate N-acetyltransferase
MKVLLLAAGRSRRVKPVEDKNFLRFCGKYLIEHQVDALKEAGFDDILLVGGAHNLERLNDFAKTSGATIQVIEQKDLDDGMAGAVVSARDHLDANEPLFIVSSNDVVDASAYQLIHDAAQNDDFDSHILGKKVSEYFPGGYLVVENDSIQGIQEKPGSGNEPSDLVNLVLHLHKNSDALFDALDSATSDRDDRYEVALETMIKNGIKMEAVSYDNYWQPIKFPWHIFDVARYFFDKATKGISDSAQIDDSAVIQGDVIIDDNAKVLAGATIVGPAYIGKGSVVATNALVRDSYLGERCVVGFSTEVARSVWGDDVWTHSNYVGDSILGNNVSFGAGTVTGNLRFDEANVQVSIGKGKVDSGTDKLGLITGDNIRVGINTSFMPGIKIGSNTMVCPGLIVNQDVPENSYVKGETILKISENRSKLDLPSREDNLKKL